MKSFKMDSVPVMGLFTLGVGLSSPHVGAATYADHIAPTKPVAWWGMNETGAPDLASTADLSGA